MTLGLLMLSFLGACFVASLVGHAVAGHKGSSALHRCIDSYAVLAGCLVLPVVFLVAFETRVRLEISDAVWILVTTLMSLVVMLAIRISRDSPNQESD